MARVTPQFPLYIPSKSRADSRLTVRSLQEMNVPFRVVIEEQQWADYVAVIPAANLLVLDKQYQRDYDTFDELGLTKSVGPGAARNFIWDHAISEGHAWHWVMDDNIKGFYHLHRNRRTPCADGTPFVVMEDFCLRYTNIAMAGPNYTMFAPSRTKAPPFVANTRIYSCNLIRNDVPFRWRGRYNEDTDLSLRMLKAGWCTVQFNAFLQNKINTQQIKGGNTEAFYAGEGTRAKSEMQVRMHPDVSRLVFRFGRVHHHVDYRPFRKNKLVRRPDLVLPATNPYALAIVPAPHGPCLTVPAEGAP
jgi:hypothetical protein